jgi:hypothetical protein
MAGSGGQAPVCNLNPNVETAQGQIATLPYIPPATDLPSAISAANAMRQIMLQYFNLNPALPSAPGSGSGGNVTNVGAGGNGGNFTEVSKARKTQEGVKIPVKFDANGSPYLEIDQIQAMTFQNKMGQTVYWNQTLGTRPPSGG